MSEFVDECRREWRRLGVPEAVANEMAADLEADLEEAEAEGVSAEAVLGSSAFDPRSFAASWAAERGVIEPPSAPPLVQGRRTPKRPFVVAAIALVLIAFGALALSVHRSVVVRQAVGLPFGRAAISLPSPLGRVIVPAGPRGQRLGRGFRPVPSAMSLAVNVNAPEGGLLRGIGLLLLVLGAAGFALALYWSPWRLSRRRGS